MLLCCIFVLSLHFTLEQLATDIRMLAYKVYGSDTFQRREAEEVKCFIKAVKNEHIVQALIQVHPVLSMVNVLKIVVRLDSWRERSAKMCHC